MAVGSYGGLGCRPYYRDCLSDSAIKFLNETNTKLVIEGGGSEACPTGFSRVSSAPSLIDQYGGR